MSETGDPAEVVTDFSIKKGFSVKSSSFPLTTKYLGTVGIDVFKTSLDLQERSAFSLQSPRRTFFWTRAFKGSLNPRIIVGI